MIRLAMKRQNATGASLSQNRAETKVLGTLLIFASNDIVTPTFCPLGGSFWRVSRSGRSGGRRVLRVTDLKQSDHRFCCS